MRLPPRARIAGGAAFSYGTATSPCSPSGDARVRGGQISTVYQDPMSSLNPLMTVGRQITEAIDIHEDVGRREARRRAIEVLGDVGLPQPERRIDDHPHHSRRDASAHDRDGDRTNPDVLIADEPTTALDVTTQARIMEMLDRIVEERRMGVILITHDLGLASSFCDDIHVMYAGRIVESGTAAAVLSTPAHPYSEALLDSICGLDRPVDQPIAAISGQPPLPHRLPGCPFHPRCAYAQESARSSRRPSSRSAGRARSVTSSRRRARERDGREDRAHRARPRWRAAARRRSPEPALPPRWAAVAAHRQAVDDVSLVLNRGETIGLVGESGRASPRSLGSCSASTSPRRAASTSSRPISSEPDASFGGRAARCRSSSRTCTRR